MSPLRRHQTLQWLWARLTAREVLLALTSIVLLLLLMFGRESPTWSSMDRYTTLGVFPEQLWHSQSKEDFEMASHILRSLGHLPRSTRDHPRTVMESGALDGDYLSNSYFFEHALGWRAVHVEPARDSYAVLRLNRPHAINLNMALCPEETTVTLVESGISPVNAVEGAMSKEFQQRWHSDINKDVRYEVRCGPLSSYLPLVGVYTVDVWFLDVEGGELQALRGVDFEAVSIHYIVIEMDGNDLEREAVLRTFLTEKGFALVSKLGQERNELFENAAFDQ